MIGSIVDIHERVEAENRLKLAIAGTAAGIWDRKDFSSNKVWWSPKLYEQLGYRPNEIEITAEAFVDMLHPEDRQRAIDLARIHYDEQVPFTLDYRLRTKHGNYRWFTANAQAEWDGSGNPTRMVGSLVDITERKLAEKVIRETSEELERKNSELEQFTYIASHDLQEPIRTMMGLIDLFLDQHGDKLNEEEREYFKMMKGSNHRAQELIIDLMDYSQLGNEKVAKPVDLNQVLKAVMDDLNALITSTEAMIRSDDLPTVIGHETELRLLIQNLIGNALKFRKPRVAPSIDLRAHDHNDGKGWLITVHDNGIGMEEKDLRKVFVIFKRLHDRSQYPGTGIGLAHCKKIVELHGGKIWVESVFGLGSTFSFTLPKKY